MVTHSLRLFRFWRLLMVKSVVQRARARQNKIDQEAQRAEKARRDAAQFYKAQNSAILLERKQWAAFEAACLDAGRDPYEVVQAKARPAPVNRPRRWVAVETPAMRLKNNDRLAR